jgi:hypothetical protein
LRYSRKRVRRLFLVPQQGFSHLSRKEVFNRLS